MKADDLLWQDQYGFRKGCGTHDAIAALRLLCERGLENNNKTANHSKMIVQLITVMKLITPVQLIMPMKLVVPVTIPV